MKSKGSFGENLDGYQHFRCVKRKRIVDFYLKLFDNIAIPKSLGRKLIILKKAYILKVSVIYVLKNVKVTETLAF